MKKLFVIIFVLGVVVIAELVVLSTIKKFAITKESICKTNPLIDPIEASYSQEQRAALKHFTTFVLPSIKQNINNQSASIGIETSVKGVVDSFLYNEATDSYQLKVDAGSPRKTTYFFEVNEVKNNKKTVYPTYVEHTVSDFVPPDILRSNQFREDLIPLFSRII